MPRIPVRWMPSVGTEGLPGEGELVTDTGGECAFTVERSRDTETLAGYPSRLQTRAGAEVELRVGERVAGQEPVAARPTVVSGPAQPWSVKQK